MILTELWRCKDRRNIRYRKWRASCTIVYLKRGTIRKEDAIFDYLQKEVNNPTFKYWARMMCISEATWRLSDHRTTLRRNHPVEQQGLHTVSRHFQATLQKESLWRVSMMGGDIESLMNARHTREAWGTIQRWYRH